VGTAHHLVHQVDPGDSGDPQAVSPGEAPSFSAFIPASRIDGQSLPRGMCLNPSPGAIGIAPIPDTSSQVGRPSLLVT
jgi:hypothetical protein